MSDVTHDDEPELDVKHPLSDSEGEGSVRTESRQIIVRLNSGRADLIAKATREGGRVILVTDGWSRLTEAMRSMLVESGGAWVVRSSDGVLRDGLTGRWLERFQDVFTTPPPAEIGDIARAYLRPHHADTTQLIVSMSLRHRAAEQTLLGDAVETFTTMLGGQLPSGWGVHEPAGRPWDRAALTMTARSRMPEATRFVVVGDYRLPVALNLTATRTDRGVEELITGMIGLGLADRATTAERRALVPDILARIAERQMPLFALVLERNGLFDLTTPCVLQNPPRPLAMLVGAPAVSAMKLDPAALFRAVGARAVGRPRTPALLFPLDGDGPRLAQALDAIGLEVLAGELGLTDAQVQEVRSAARQ